jgi:hypothetical protein
MVEVAKLNLSLSMGKVTKEEAIESLRKQLVNAMRKGDRYVLNCGRTNINFLKEFNDPVNFPIDLIFNFDEWRKDEVYKKIVRPEED